MKKATKDQMMLDNALVGMFKRVEEKSRVIIAEGGDPIANAYRIVELVKQWERARDALIKLDDML
jgi:hypothetical protein